MNTTLITSLIKTHALDWQHDYATGEVKTTCAYCGVGCGIIASVDTTSQNLALNIKGDPEHPANFGRLCVKGSSLGETVHTQGRLLQPMIAGQTSTWDDATTYISQQLQQVIAQYGANSVALYVSGQLLTEDYYVANKFVKGYLGTANIDTNSRLCMSSAVAGHKRAFGSDTVPNCYEDIEHAELIVLVGSNTAWCHPIIFQRIKAAKDKNPQLKIVNIDPRATATNEIADLHLPIKSGMDVLLFNYVLVQLADSGALDHYYIDTYTNGLDNALANARQDIGSSAQDTANRIGISLDALNTFVRYFISTPKTLTLFAVGVNQSNQGTDKVNAIINAHLATGRVGKVGAGAFSLTGQPNAMGGREVGGLANTLAAHLDIDNPQHQQLVQDFWQSPNIAKQQGLKAVDLFEAVHSGQIKAIWIMATNPVVSMPNANRVKEALEKCPLVIVSEVMADTDCTRLAHVVLPALAWGEKDGTVTNSERCISRQRAVLPVTGDAKPDWWAIAQVAQKMAFSGFNYSQPYQVFVEHAALSGYHNHRQAVWRDFDISGLAQLSFEQYQNLEPLQWPVKQALTLDKYGQTKRELFDVLYNKRLFAQGDFFTPNGRANIVPVAHVASTYLPSKAYPLILNTGRVRDQWHTMTRTGQTARLSQHISEPFVQMHPNDALALGIQSGDIVAIKSAWGMATARAVISQEQQAGMVFMPMHWTAINSKNSRVGAVVNPVVDPVSGQPAFKLTPVFVKKVQINHCGYILSQQVLPLLEVSVYSVNVRHDLGFRQVFAIEKQRPKLVKQWVKHLNIPKNVETLFYQDEVLGICRIAWLQDDTLIAVLMLAQDQVHVPEHRWLVGLLGQRIDKNIRRYLLSGSAPDSSADVGEIICACFGVGKNTICNAIKTQKLTTVKAVGDCLKAGTNCGSCQSEIAKLIEVVC